MKDKRLIPETLGCLHITWGYPQACGDHSEHLLNLLLDKETTEQMTSFHRAHNQHVPSWEGERERGSCVVFSCHLKCLKCFFLAQLCTQRTPNRLSLLSSVQQIRGSITLWLLKPEGMSRENAFFFAVLPGHITFLHPLHLTDQPCPPPQA